MMRFAHECNKNNIYDTMRDEFAWHSKLLTNRLRVISLLEMIRIQSNFYGPKNSSSRSNPEPHKEF